MHFYEAVILEIFQCGRGKVRRELQPELCHVTSIMFVTCILVYRETLLLTHASLA